MNITQEKNDLVSTITLEIKQEDYQKNFEQSLNKQAKQAQIKGFRKGKVPKNLVKKMYGNAILADEINRLINQNINEYLQKEKMEIIGQPMPVAQDDVRFDVYNLSDFTFKYEVGLRPEVSVDFLDSKPEFTQYEIEITDEMIDKEIEHVKGQYGDVEHPEGKPEGKDAMQVNLRELDEEGNVKEGGYEHSTAFGFDQLKLKKDQTAIGKLNVGDTYAPFNIYRAFDNDKETIAKQMLELDADVMGEIGTAFELKLVQINRVGEAELNQEFFDKLYGEGKVTSEEEMREKIKENLSNYLSTATNNQLKNEIYKGLLEQTDVRLPDEFLKNWLKETRKDKEEEVSEEDIDNEYPAFAKNLTSSFIFNAVAKKGEISVEYDELQEKIKSNLIEQFKYYGMPLEENEEMLQGMMQRFMENQEQVQQTHDQLMDEKIFDYLKENVKMNSKVVSLDHFNELNKE